MNALPNNEVKFAWDELPARFPGFRDPGRWLPLLQHHQRLIEASAGRVRVTAVAPDEAVRRHYAESLELLRIVRAHTPAGPLVDVGSGGGFPGLAIAAVEPETPVHLVEPLQKRARFLQDAAAELGLANVQVHAMRAEDAGRGPLRNSAAVVTARAVAELRELLEYTAPLAAPGALLAFPKGSALPGELEAARHALSELGCEFLASEPMRPEISPTVSVALIRKAAPTPAAYPRRAGIPHKRPL
ncbi:MAG: 16S rRNA (guanine(527)-N(7))-methyltransferase RsmG [Hyphomicrobiales bacterium]